MVSETAPDHLACLKFKELIEARSNGRFAVQIFPNGTLGGERDMIEGCQMGTLGMTLASSGVVANSAPDLSVLDLPYLFRDLAHARKALHGEIGEELASKIDKTGVKTLGWLETGFRNLWNSKREIHSLKDIQGLKIRLQEITPHLELFRALGADPTPLAWGDAYTGIQQGAIDGLELPNSLSYTLSLYEICKYYAITEHVFTAAPLMMSGKLWKSLSAEDQKLVQQCATEACEYEGKLSEQVNKEYLDKLKEKGSIVTYPDKKELIERAMTIYPKYEKRYGDLIKRIQAL